MRKRGESRLKRNRHVQQGGGKFTRTAPAVRRVRARAKAKAVREARKANR